MANDITESEFDVLLSTSVLSDKTADLLQELTGMLCISELVSSHIEEVLDVNAEKFMPAVSTQYGANFYYIPPEAKRRLTFLVDEAFSRALMLRQWVKEDEEFWELVRKREAELGKLQFGGCKPPAKQS